MDLHRLDTHCFSPSHIPRLISEPGHYILGSNPATVTAELFFVPNFLSPEAANSLLANLQVEVPWQQRVARRHGGVKVEEPRLTHYVGPAYKYGSVAWPTNNDWPSCLYSQLQKINRLPNFNRFPANSVMCNKYRGATDCIGWHADDEPHLGIYPTIASISVGATRAFEIRSFANPRQRTKIYLPSGSLLIMAGSFQELYQHRVARAADECGVRINLTFRRTLGHGSTSVPVPPHVIRPSLLRHASSSSVTSTIGAQSSSAVAVAPLQSPQPPAATFVPDVVPHKRTFAEVTRSPFTRLSLPSSPSVAIAGTSANALAVSSAQSTSPGVSQDSFDCVFNADSQSQSPSRLSNFVIAYPLPSSLSCPGCPYKTRRYVATIADPNKPERLLVKAMRSHVRNSHMVDPWYPFFRCVRCQLTVKSMKQLQQHECRASQVGTISVDSFGNLLIPHPKVCTKCNICDHICTHTGRGLRTTLINHYFSAHQSKPNFLWVCSNCNMRGDGLFIKAHNCRSSQPAAQSNNEGSATSPSSPLPSAPTRSASSIHLPSSPPPACVNFAPGVLSPNIGVTGSFPCSSSAATRVSKRPATSPLNNTVPASRHRSDAPTGNSPYSSHNASDTLPSSPVSSLAPANNKTLNNVQVPASKEYEWRQIPHKRHPTKLHCVSAPASPTTTRSYRQTGHIKSVAQSQELYLHNRFEVLEVEHSDTASLFNTRQASQRSTRRSRKRKTRSEPYSPFSSFLTDSSNNRFTMPSTTSPVPPLVSPILSTQSRPSSSSHPTTSSREGIVNSPSAAGDVVLERRFSDNIMSPQISQISAPASPMAGSSSANTAMHFPLPELTNNSQARHVYWSQFQEHWISKLDNISSSEQLDFVAETWACNLNMAYRQMHGMKAHKNSAFHSAESRQSIQQLSPSHQIPQPLHTQERPPIRHVTPPQRPIAVCKKLTQEYFAYPKKAVRRILEEDKPLFQGDVSSATSFLTDVYSSTSSTGRGEDILHLYQQCQFASPTADALDNLAAPPSPADILFRLKRTSNSSPGSDGIEYRFLKEADGDGLQLSCLYKKVFEFSHIPACWKVGKTIFIHKSGDPNDISNFRPITLLPTAYKLLSGIIAYRIIQTANEYQWLSECQKGFLPGSHGLDEHTFVLQSLIQQNKIAKKDYLIAFLDLKNAFGSIPHSSLQTMLNCLPIPNSLRAVIADIYTNASSTFCLGTEAPILPLVSGVLQGDPLSPIMFNLALEPVLRSLSRCHGQSVLGSTNVGVSAYADDLALAFTNKEHLQNAINEAVETGRLLNLTFRPSKCYILSNKDIPSPPISICTHPLQVVANGESVKYLGIPLSNTSLFPAPEDVIQRIHKLTGCRLPPHLKVEVLRANILPSIFYLMSSGCMKQQSLNKVDASLKNALRLILQLPHCAANAAFQAHRRHGGMGFSLPSQDAYVLTVAKALRIINSKDERVAAVARAQIHNILRPVIQQPTTDDISAFLSGSTDGPLADLQFAPTTTFTLWSRARAAARRLNVKIKIDDTNSNNSFIQLGSTQAPFKNGIKAMRQALRDKSSTELMSMELQGLACKSLHDFDQNAETELPQLLGKFSPLSHEDYKLSVKGRLNLLPTRGARHYNPTPASEADRYCRMCNLRIETTKHVVCGCQSSLPAYKSRHDQVVEAIAAAIPRHMTITRDARFPGAPDRLRPDLVIFDPNTNRRHIVEVAVCNEDPERIAEERETNTTRYAHYGCPSYPITVGAFGLWDQANNKLAKALNIPIKRWEATRKQCRKLVISSTCNIVRSHLRNTVLG